MKNLSVRNVFLALLFVVIIVSLLLAGCQNDHDPQSTPTHKHTFSDIWESDATYHWHAATCEHSSETSDKAKHVFDANGKCSVCQYQKKDEKPTPTTYTVTFVADGNTVKIVTYNEGATKVDEPNVPSKKGYTGKWELYELNDSNLTVNAVYTVIEYTITYNNVQDAGNDNPQVYTVEYPGTIVLSSAIKYDYLFVGWFGDEQCNESSRVTEIDPSEAQNIVLWAKWERAPIYVLSDDSTTFTFGQYPQRKVSNEDLITALTNKVGGNPDNNNAWHSYSYYLEGVAKDYAWYTDVMFNGSKYRGVYFSQYRPRSSDGQVSGKTQQESNKFQLNTVYWYLYEPITWNILNNSNGTALIVASKILDSQEWNHIAPPFNSFVGPIEQTYENSSIRSFLNDTFYNTAFDSASQQLIQITAVANGENSTKGSGNPNICADTKDRVFLLSYQEINTYLQNENARKLKVSAYAASQGASSSSGYWWLRSVTSIGNICSYNHTGTFQQYLMSYTSAGIVPPLNIKLQ